jgi:hypothetical protein
MATEEETLLIDEFGIRKPRGAFATACAFSLSSSDERLRKFSGQGSIGKILAAMERDW